eukprot:TRINITY_DN67177_c0_g1_i1.p1 TRINITY_DN67177_c0_g1~~TRINITY_DN67177_c0_g1_i1.p1  ORF type:complete len:444 (-),score=95.99 TRINITY_DN67177_c0_g1_i1:66-1397(-)
MAAELAAEDSEELAQASLSSLERPSASAEEIQNVAISVAQYTELAQNLRQKGLTSRAIRMMERAVLTCSRHESGHPALAVEAAKARVNLAAALSEGLRHDEALAVIKEAQVGLAQVLIWAGECDPPDPVVVSIQKEATQLRLAAIVAEQIQLDLCSPDDPDSSKLQDELAKEAKETAVGLGQRHPLSSLVSATVGSLTFPKGLQRNNLQARASRLGLGGLGPGASTPLGQAASRGVLATSPSRQGASPSSLPMPPTVEEKGQERLPSARASPKGSRPNSRAEGQAESSPPQRPRRFQEPEEKVDVFTDFLRGIQAERVAELLRKNDDWEEQTKSKLRQVHRTTKLYLELSPDDELKEKRYTRTGHQVFMKGMKAGNKCWSDPSLCYEARREKASPEVMQMRRLNKRLYVKPPPGPPPPAKEKPKIDASLAGNIMGGMNKATKK